LILPTYITTRKPRTVTLNADLGLDFIPSEVAIPSLSDVYRYFKFNKLYALGGGDYSTGTAYIREEVTNNNNYGQLVNFTNPALLKFF
jgi:hypothetical protein